MIFPGDVGMFYKSAPGAFPRPLDQLLYGLFLAFADDLDTAVREIPDPSRKTETLRLTLCAVTEEDTLHHASDDYMYPCFQNNGPVYAKTPPTHVW